MDVKNLNHWLITGLIDAEGSFIVDISKDSKRKLGYIISVSLQMGLNYKDKILLEIIKTELGVGEIYFNKADNTYKWKVSNVEQLYSIVIPFLRTYYLVSQKRIDFEIFVRVVDLIRSKEHLTSQGLQEIISLKCGLNLGLSDKLKKDFPNIIAVPRPALEFKGIPNGYWLSGFAEGEACFFIRTYKSPKSKLGYAIQPVFIITQHSRDMALMESIAKYFACGNVKKRSSEACDFTVTSIKALIDIIIPFFDKYPLRGQKLLNYNDFKSVIEIVQSKEHLTDLGFNKILDIKKGMNTGRK